MKKKVFTILIAIAVLCGFAACSGGSTPDPAPARTSFDIKIERPEHGSIVLGEDCADYTVKKGGDIVVTLVPDEGYEVGGAEYTDGMGKHVLTKDKIKDETFTIKNVTADVTISATFDEETDKPEPITPYTVATAVEGGGTLTASAKSVNPGDEVTFTAKANLINRLASVLITKSDGSAPHYLDMSLVSREGVFTLVPEYDIIVTAKFEAVTEYYVTVVGSTGGEVTASSDAVEPYGSVAFTITVEEYYSLGSFKVNGVDRTAEAKTGSVKINNVIEDIEIECEFVPVEHNVTVIQTAYGSIKALKTAPHGSVLTVSFVPDSGYVLFSVTVNGQPYDGELPADGVIGLPVGGDITVTAEFREKREAVGVSGTLEIAGAASPAGVALVVTAADGTEKRITTNADGSFSTTLPSGSYRINIDAFAVKMDERTFLVSYDDVTLALSAFVPSFATDGFTEGYDGGATLKSAAAATAFAKFTAENAALSADVTVTGSAGVIVKTADKTLKIAYANGGVTVAYGDKTIFATNKIKLGGAIRVVRYGNALYIFSADGKTYETVIVNGLRGAGEYGFYSDGAAEFASVTAGVNLDEIEKLVVKAVKITRVGSGTVVIDGATDGKARLGSEITILVTPSYGYKIDEVTFCDNEADYVTETDGTRTYRFTVTTADTNVIAAYFTPVADGETEEFSAATVSDGTGGGLTYDTTLFYRNDLEIDGADPGVIYVSEEEDTTYGGWFYMATTGGSGNSAFPLYRSRDLARWERAGKAGGGNALTVGANAWTETYYWAPELIRDPKTGKYFIFFSAGSKQGNANTEYVACDTNTNGDGKWNRLYIGIGISDNPMGPYELVTAEKYYGAGRTVNLNGETITASTPPVNFGKNFKTQLAAMTNNYIDPVTGNGIWPAIDVSPFITESGDMYLYFSQHVSSITDGNRIWGMKMKDMITPDYSTLTLLLMPYDEGNRGKSVHMFEGTKGDINFNNWTGTNAPGAYDGDICEGAFTIEHGGKFYLCYSPFGYGDRKYSIMQSVGDTPLGPFRKLSRDYANPVIGIGTETQQYDFMSGTGHHSFVKAGNELFAVYHAFYNPVNNNLNGTFMGRAIGFDRVRFTYNDYYGYDVLAGTGGTFSLQPLPAVASGYSNVAGEATVTASGSTSGKDYLTDGAFPYQPYEREQEFKSSGDTTITLTFPSAKEIRAIMIYNSYTYSKAVASAEITLTLDSGKTVKTTAVTDSANYNAAKGYMRPGGAIIADFATAKVKKIEIALKTSAKLSDADNEIRVGEITVLGKTDRSKAADLPLYDVANGARPGGAFVLDGKFDEPEYAGKAYYTYTVSGVKVETTAVIAEDGVYVAARAYDDNIKWLAKNFFQINSHFEISFGGYGGSVKTIYVDSQNHSLFGDFLTASASVDGSVMTAEAFASWGALGYSRRQANVNVFAGYYRVTDTGESANTANGVYSWQGRTVKGVLLKPDNVDTSVPSTYGAYNSNGFREQGTAATFGEGYLGESAIGSITYGGTYVTLGNDENNEIWYRSACSDNFAFAATIKAAAANASGFVVSSGAEKKYLSVPAGEVNYTLIKSGSTMIVYSASAVVAAVRDPNFGGACTAGVWSKNCEATVSRAQYASYRSERAAAGAAPEISADGNKLPIIAIKGYGDVYSDDLIPNSGRATLVARPAVGYTLGSARVNGAAITVSGAFTVPAKTASSLVELEFVGISDPVTVSGAIRYTPNGGFAAGAKLEITGKEKGETYSATTDTLGNYSLVLSASETYSVTVSANGCTKSRYEIKNGEFTSTPYATRYALGGTATLGGATYTYNPSTWDMSGREDGVYVAARYGNGFFTDGVGEKAVIKFKVTNKTDLGGFVSVNELISSQTEYDPAIGIQFTDGKTSSFAGFWKSGYRVMLNERGDWNGTNVFGNSKIDGANYDHYTWNSVNKTYSHMFIRDGENVYLYYENVAGEYVKVYDSAAAGHTFAVNGKCAYGFGFTSSKSFSIEFRDVVVLTDDLAEAEIAKYVG